MAKAIKFFELNTGAKIPSIGFGTFHADPSAGNGIVAKTITTAIEVPNPP